MIAKQNLETLRGQLRHFGLNPEEWTLQPRGSRVVRIRHQQDESFRFEGLLKAKSPKPQWAELKLVSI